MKNRSALNAWSEWREPRLYRYPAKDAFIKVPVGTRIDRGTGETMGDMTKHGQRLLARRAAGMG
ncbi:hypothetical protein KCP70_08055 [Salmonella enterica subsp. enterica]|nr:hypothetical protein KCP70_08055 [Salmonella enterica subsp. enterica]